MILKRLAIQVVDEPMNTKLHVLIGILMYIIERKTVQLRGR